MDMLAAENLVLETLARAVSQEVSELKIAEAKLAEWETQQGFYSILLRVISNHNIDPLIRWMAALTFKNGVDRYWRKSAPNAISEEEKSLLRAGLLEALKEPVNQVAVQLAVLISKAARFDCPKEWPELIPTLLDVVAKEDDPLLQNRALLVLRHVIKTLASKRLAGDRRIFQELTAHVYSIFCSIHSSTMDKFFIEVQNNNPQCQDTLEKALSTIRILRKLSIFGFKDPSSSPDFLIFLSATFNRLRNLLLVRKGFGNNNPPLTQLLEKVLIHLTKVLLSVLEHHPFAFIPFITTSLSFTVSLMFTPEGDGLLFERFVVQCLNLMKATILCVEYRVSPGSYDNSETTLKAKQATEKKQAVFTQNVLVEICTKLVTHYLLLTRDELELWDSDTEGFMNEEGGESWKYHLRPCIESLYMAFFRSYREILVPRMMELLSTGIQVVNPDDLQAVLRKDAIYLATGLAAFDLYDEIEMEQWFETLLKELTIKETNYRIVRRRVTWLLGLWSNVRCSQELRPTLYSAFIPLLQGNEDLAVRLTAANSLKLAIDDFDFDADQFLEFLEPSFSLLFNLLKEVKECDTKMHVLMVLSFIVERMGEAIRPYSSSLTRYLPQLWDDSVNHDMLRCAIVSTLVHCVKAMLIEQLTTIVYPVIDVCVDLSQQSHIYLLEDGLELWLTTLHYSSSLSEPLALLAKRLPAIFEATTEHIPVLCSIIDAYNFLSPRDFMLSYGATILNCCHELLQELNGEGIATILSSVATAIRTESLTTIPIAMPIIEETFMNLSRGGGGSVTVDSVRLVIAARILLHSRELFFQIVERFSLIENITPEVGLDRILTEWLYKMVLLSEKVERKLQGLALSSLLTSRSNIVLTKIPQILQQVVETLNDIVDLDEENRQIDTLLFPEGDTETTDGEFRSETEHERRKKKVDEMDPVYNISLQEYLQSQVNELKCQIGLPPLESILQAMNPDYLSQLRSYITV